MNKSEQEDRALWQKLCIEVRPLAQKNQKHLPHDAQKQPLDYSVPEIDSKPQPIQKSVKSSLMFDPAKLFRPAGQVARMKLPSDQPEEFFHLDGRRAKRLRSGKLKPEARLDLHGLHEREAEIHFIRFFQRAIDRKHRCILVITGKGSGVLLRAFARWIQLPNIRKHLAGVSAMPDHKGGRGAYCLYLRR